MEINLARMEDKLKVLVIAPHPDDEILGVGGTIAKYVSEGHDVHICVVTEGHKTMYSEERIEKVINEARQAHEYLNVKETHFLGLPAVLLSEVPKSEINKEICKIVSKLSPDIMFIPHFGDMHHDHYIVSESSMVAARPIKSKKILEVYSYETLSESEWNIPHVCNAFIPNTFVDISSFINEKINAMSYFDSQLISEPHPRSIKAIKSLGSLRGSTIAVDFAEAFCLIRKIIL